jgi:hypothetical protein
VEHPIWNFVRGDETLTITRQNAEQGTVLVVAGDGAPRSYFFKELARLEVFQRDMETLLLKTGWSFSVYAPDRRRGRDRRGWPRRANDRRRWWTDGQEKAAPKDRTTESDPATLAPDEPVRK